MTLTRFSVAREGRVAIATLDHPPANTLDTVAIAELGRVLEELEADAAVKVVVLTGAGRFFAAGADIKEFVGKTPEEGEAMARAGQKVMDRLEAFPKPVIAAINGAALGGGLELAMACHIRIAADAAKLGLPEINLGLIPGFGGTQRLPRLIGRGRATELILTGEMITGEEAFRLGLVNRVVPLERLMDEARALAERIAAKSAVTAALALEALQGVEAPLAEGLDREARLFGRAFATEDCREGVQAFLEKRPPHFRDR